MYSYDLPVTKDNDTWKSHEVSLTLAVQWGFSHPKPLQVTKAGVMLFFWLNLVVHMSSIYIYTQFWALHIIYIYILPIWRDSTRPTDATFSWVCITYHLSIVFNSHDSASYNKSTWINQNDSVYYTETPKPATINKKPHVPPDASWFASHFPSQNWRTSTRPVPWPRTMWCLQLPGPQSSCSSSRCCGGSNGGSGIVSNSLWNQPKKLDFGIIHWKSAALAGTIVHKTVFPL